LDSLIGRSDNTRQNKLYSCEPCNSETKEIPFTAWNKHSKNGQGTGVEALP